MLLNGRDFFIHDWIEGFFVVYNFYEEFFTLLDLFPLELPKMAHNFMRKCNSNRMSFKSLKTLAYYQIQKEFLSLKIQQKSQKNLHETTQKKLNLLSFHYSYKNSSLYSFWWGTTTLFPSPYLNCYHSFRYDIITRTLPLLNIFL